MTFSQESEVSGTFRKLRVKTVNGKAVERNETEKLANNKNV